MSQIGPPSKQRGRKPIQDTGNSDPTVSKRTVQLREAQRAHRERKVQYLQDLELKVKELTEEASLVKKLKARVQQLEFEAGLRDPLSGTSTTSLLQAAAAGVLLNEVGASNCGSCVLKEFQVNELKKECQEWKEKAMSLMSMQQQQQQQQQPTPPPPMTMPLAAPTSTASLSPIPDASLFNVDTTVDTVMDELDVFLSGITPRFLTSEEIYGPVEIESTRLSLKMIPSLVGNPSVDLICDSIVALTQTSDLLAMKKIMLKFVRGINHICVNCHDAERSRVFEVIAMHFERNLLHTQYSVQFWSVFLPPLPAEIQISHSKPGLIAYINQLQENLQQLPSLAAAGGDIVLEFCNTLKLAFGNQSTEAFFRIGYCLNKLFVATSLQDRAQLLRYFNGLREAQLDDVDDLVTRAEEITLK